MTQIFKPECSSEPPPYCQLPICLFVVPFSWSTLTLLLFLTPIQPSQLMPSPTPKTYLDAPPIMLSEYFIICLE